MNRTQRYQTSTFRQSDQGRQKRFRFDPRRVPTFGRPEVSELNRPRKRFNVTALVIYATGYQKTIAFLRWGTSIYDVESQVSGIIRDYWTNVASFEILKTIEVDDYGEEF